MAAEYAVVWCESDGPRFVGRLSVEGAGLRLRGASAEGELWDRVLGPDDVEGSRSVVVELRDGACLSVVALDGAGVLFEIANLTAELSGRARRVSTGVAVEVPIRRGHRDRVRALVGAGPPFDPVAVPELESHDVYVGRDHVVFIFRGENVRDAVEKLMHTPSVWLAAADWRRSIAGRPYILEDGYAWRRHGS